MKIQRPKRVLNGKEKEIFIIGRDSHVSIMGREMNNDQNIALSVPSLKKVILRIGSAHTRLERSFVFRVCISDGLI